MAKAKSKNVAKAKAAPEGSGDVWTWTVLDSDSKMILAYEIGDRSVSTASEFMTDLRSRLANRVQLTTDGRKAYLEAIEDAFGGDVDFAQLVKLYCNKGSKLPEGKYSPPVCTMIKKHRVGDSPDPSHVSTSHVERSNLSMGMGRFTRLKMHFLRNLKTIFICCSCILCIIILFVFTRH